MAAPTPEQQALIDRLSAWLAATPEVEAAWLSGSLGRGAGDAFSDVDILVMTADGGAAELSVWLKQELATVAEPVLVNDLFGGRVLNVITADWSRFDISIVEQGELAGYNARQLTALFNKVGIEPPSPPDLAYRTTPAQLSKLVSEFFRVLGLSPVVIGRGEFFVALSGMELLRSMTLELMLEENDLAPWRRGGVLARNHQLTSDQRDELASLPPLVGERASLIEGHAAIARVFLPRARRLAEAIGMTWPEAFEAATRRRLKSALRLEI